MSIYYEQKHRNLCIEHWEGAYEGKKGKGIRGTGNSMENDV